MSEPLTAAGMERIIRVYYDGCNRADRATMIACFTPDGTHYFPPGMYAGPFVGAETIADRWVAAVETFGSAWTIDSFIADPAAGHAVVEWSHFKQFQGTVLRGIEWFDFDADSGLIREIRAYYASPQDASLERLELGGFDYVGRGWATEPAPEHRRGA